MNINKNISVEYYNHLVEDIKNIRETVFVLEQGFYEEFDKTDDNCIHILVKIDSKKVATARIFKSKGDNEKWTVGRFAVLKDYRGQGIGSLLMRIAEEKIKENGGLIAELSAQKQAEKFYLSLGYISSGNIYYDQHAPHIHMEKVI